MSNDYTQDFIEEVKGALGEPEESIEIPEVDLVPYATKQLPILGGPAFSSRIVLNPVAIFPTSVTSDTAQFELEWIPFAIFNSSGTDDDEGFKTTIAGQVRNLFMRPQLMSMYSRLIQSNNFPNANDLITTLNNVSTKILLDEFIRIEVRGISEYCAYYTLQRLPKFSGSDPLEYSYKLSWDGSNGKRYYTIISFTLPNEGASDPGEVSITDILVEGAELNPTVQIFLDNDLMDDEIIAYLETNVDTIFTTVMSAYDYTDLLEFAKNVDSFNVEFVYQSVKNGSYGVITKHAMRFNRVSYGYDKQDQYLTWPRYCDFTYRGMMETSDNTRIIDMTYSYMEEDYTGGTGEFTFRYGTLEYMWN